MEAIIFMFCLTLHNIEEALWFTDWLKKAMPNSRRIQSKPHFIFAVLGVTIVGYLAAGLFLLYPDNKYLECVFIGFVGSMLINAVFPHLALTIRFKSYCPGVLTGCFLIIPLHGIVLLTALIERLTIGEVLISTLIVGLMLLGLISFMLKLASKVFNPRDFEV